MTAIECAGFVVVPSTANELSEIMNYHFDRLIYPMDSWLEDNLLTSDHFAVKDSSGTIVGYAAIKNKDLRHFFVLQNSLRYGPQIMETIIKAMDLERVFVMTQDQQMSTWISEWDYTKDKHACFFSDAEGPSVVHELRTGLTFREAFLEEAPLIQEISGDFFDDASCGYANLKERIQDKTIFVLLEDGNYLGFGIVEKSIFGRRHVSIGMFVNPLFRKRGAAKTLLLELKKWSYDKGLVPVSGCWYYNTLSRKSLESAGMVVTSTGYMTRLISKEVLPLRTGNPPGELVEP